MTATDGRELQAVLFDLDGLLVDTEPLWIRSAGEILGRRGHAWDLALRPKVMGRHPLEVARFMIEHYGLDDDPVALMEERLALQRQLYASEGIEPMPGALTLVRELVSAGIPRAVASGSPTALVTTCLDALGLRGSFGVAIGSDRVAKGKPAPDVFLAAARALGVDPRGCAVLEDADNGVAAALAADMICVKVTRDERGGAGAQLLLESLEALDVSTLRGLFS
jgi:HAD superfamily hydrolase (TIGR01509 family)